MIRQFKTRNEFFDNTHYGRDAQAWCWTSGDGDDRRACFSIHRPSQPQADGEILFQGSWKREGRQNVKAGHRHNVLNELPLGTLMDVFIYTDGVEGGTYVEGMYRLVHRIDYNGLILQRVAFNPLAESQEQIREAA